MAFYTNENLKANSPRSNGDTLQIHQQLSPEDYQMQRQLNERADYKRYASLNTPTYGMWNGESFESTDPNRIAEINANAEMRRTGLDRYYHPNSAAYYAAFQGIRDKYLQQEMAKKAAIENEGKQLYSNRMGAFDKLIQDQYGIQKEKIESAGLEGLRRSQAKQAEAIVKSYEGDGMSPKEKTAALWKNADIIMKQGDDIRAAITEKIKNSTDKQEIGALINSLGKLQGHIDHDIAAVKRGEQPTGLTEFNRWLSDIRGYKPLATNEIIVTGPDGRKYKQVPKSAKTQQGNGMVFQVGGTGLGETPEKPKPQSLEDRLFYGRKRNN